jgi:hypothetical protein
MHYHHTIAPWLLRCLAVWSVAIALFPVARAQQSAVAGKWEGTTRNDMRVVLTLKVADAVLTGSVTRGDQTATITEGKVSGKTITFKAVLGGEPETLSGELDGQQLKVWLDRQGREGTVVFTRAKE